MSMTFVILIVWCILSVFAGTHEVISTSDMYIGMTIILAAMYIERVLKKGT